MRSLSTVLCLGTASHWRRFALLAFLCLLPGCSIPVEIHPPAPRAMPSVSAELVGLPEPVFDTRQACEQIDIPDALPRAFRDANNRVHLVATHYVARAMIGPALDQVKHDCRVIYRSPNDPDPAHFLDANWLSSFYTEDGLRIAALVHSEYHGFEHPGMCGEPKSPRRTDDCAWTTITFAESRDGGYSFIEPKPPANLVASLPYRYDPDNRRGPQGYDSPTNILKIGQFYYAMVNVWGEYRAQRYGPCLIRTANLFDPSSWRAWNGSGFAIQFTNPYVGQNADSSEHVCPPIIPGTLDSLAVDERSGIFLADVYVKDDRYGQGSGLYIAASRDLIRWSKPVLVANTDFLLRTEPRGRWSYLYFTLMDPASTDRNFTTVSSTPYIYYVRFDDDNPPYARVLFRRRINISIKQ